MARPRIAFVSPVPPARTGIADWAAQVLPPLADETELVTLDADAPGAAEVAGAADLAIHAIGNHAGFHAGILRLARRVPGLVVLHDIRLGHLLAGSTGRAELAALLGDLYGREGTGAGRRFLRGALSAEALAARFPMTEAATGNALAVVVHDPGAVEALRPGAVPVLALPLPWHAGPRPAPPAPREGPIRLLAFGHLGPNRRLHAIVDALAAAGGGAARYRLDILGTVEGEPALRAHVAAAGLADAVVLHGHVPDAALDAAIAAADLAFNLRFPSMGEASGSQLRLFAWACPSMVTRTGWYGSLPEDAVLFAAPGAEGRDIAAALAALAVDRHRFRTLGRRGRALLEARHDPGAYARALRAVADAAPALRQAHRARALARAAAARLAGPPDAATAEALARAALAEAART